MKLRNAGRIVAIATAASFAIATMSGAFGLPPIQDEFQQCLDNATGGDIDSIDVAKRISCCKQAGGAWVEIYDADGNVVDAFCDGAEEVFEPEPDAARLPTINPALLGGVLPEAVIGVAPAATPAAAAVSDGGSDLAAVSGDAGPAVVLEPAAEEPAPTSSPAPKKIKRKHHRRHRAR